MQIHGQYRLPTVGVARCVFCRSSGAPDRPAWLDRTVTPRPGSRRAHRPVRATPANIIPPSQLGAIGSALPGCDPAVEHGGCGVVWLAVVGVSLGGELGRGEPLLPPSDIPSGLRWWYGVENPVATHLRPVSSLRRTSCSTRAAPGVTQFLEPVQHVRGESPGRIDDESTVTSVRPVV